MMILITGGSGSGKSAYAEEYMTGISGGSIKYYIATMQAFDREAKEKIEKHRRMRSGKGFSTIEQPLNINEALEKMKPGKRTALLECVSNLTANEMFSKEESKESEAAVKKIISQIKQLNEGVDHLVIVTNNIFEDGCIYDETTMKYIRAMGSINENLAHLADKVIEIVVGIPIILKDERLSE
jgi:adenosylcobinamide kinase/adenosylcobinamide-phosphate guanylyltransferase